jgi:3-hydroxy-D-aspartate aldolase
MKDHQSRRLEVGYDIPAVPGMDEADIQTPCLCSTSTRWSATSRRWATMPRPMACATASMARCTNPSMWRSCRMELGGACRRVLPEGVRGRGVRPRRHQGRAGLQPGARPAKIDRLARLPKLGARTICCVDDWPMWPTCPRRRRSTAPDRVPGGDRLRRGRCGVTTTQQVVESPRPSTPRRA